MNNTHYVLINENSSPFAIVRKGNVDLMRQSILQAIQSEYDHAGEIDIPHISFEDSNFQKEDVSQVVNIRIDDYNEAILIKPIWEY
jgi:hypothetical protein